MLTFSYQTIKWHVQVFTFTIISQCYLVNIVMKIDRALTCIIVANKVHTENTTISANMKSGYFKWVFLLKNLQEDNGVNFTRLPFVSNTYTVDSTSCIVSQGNIHVKSCRVHMKSSRKLKKKRSFWRFSGLVFSVCCKIFRLLAVTNKVEQIWYLTKLCILKEVLTAAVCLCASDL